MSEERGNESPCEMSQSVRSGSHVSSSVSVKSDQSKGDGPDFSEETEPQTKCSTLQNETLDPGSQTGSRSRNQDDFTDSFLWIFQDLETKIITFLKKELEKFKKILQKENLQNLVNNFNENKCSIKDAALDLTLYFLRDMKQDEAADTLEDELIFIHQLKCSLKKKYQCVFEGIAKQGDSTLLKNIYTDLYITQGCSEQVNTEHEVRQIEVASRHHEPQETQVECKDLFEAPEQDKQVRTVLTKGVAGIGKSVSVQKFVLDWAEKKENQDISFIFPLPFREMNLKEHEKLSLMDLITQFFPETKGLNLTRRNQFKVLFILDGLDECRLPVNFQDNEMLSDVSSPASLDVLLTNLIKGNLLPSALIWITTRPAAASKIPPGCIDRLTEIRGFNDAQKEEYFRKRISNENLAKEIIDHVKQSRSLFIMCHIPVFCWISATVLQNSLEVKMGNNVVKNIQADDASKTLQESNTEDTPKTLTQMYTHFLRFQIQQSRRKYDGEYRPDVSWDKDAIFSLGKLAFDQLERNNVIFYDTDLKACGIDVYKASVYSGMCTQIFKEETGIVLGTMYCFVHLSIQEFIAALHAHLFLDIKKRSIFVHKSSEQESKSDTMIDLLKSAVDKALESNNGHLDLFLRFLLGLSLQSNRQLLRGLLTQQNGNDQIKNEIVQYIKQKFEADLSPERSINLFYCLNELNDQTLVKDIQTHLSKGSLSSADLSPAQWSALAFVLLTSEEELEEFELQKFKKSDKCLIRLLAVIKTTKRALLNDCGLTDKSCSALATVLGSDTSLKELNMSNNNLQDSGVKLLCAGLENIKCHLEILRLSDCSVTEEGYKALASALRSNPSHLIELDLTGNDPGQSGVKELSDLLQDPNCQLKTLRLSNCNITEEGYKALASALRSNPSHLIELDLIGNDPGQSGVKELDDLLQDPNCQLKTLRFLGPAADEACQYVTGIVGKNPLLLSELNLSEHELGDTRVNQTAALLQDKHCQLNTLILWRCRITEEECLILTAALKSNPSHLRELDLSENQIKNTGVNQLCDVLKDSHCKLERLRLRFCDLTDKGCAAVTSALKSNPLHLRELNLSGNQLGDSGVKNLSDLLMNPQFKLEKLHLWDCSITKEQCLILTSALKSNPSHLRELNLSDNKLGDSGVKNLSDLLMNPQFKLEKLHLYDCSITEEQCLILCSALKSNPSHLRELDLSENQIKNTGVNLLCDILKDSHCKLERLRLSYCDLTDECCSAVTLALKSNPSHLRELNLSKNELRDSGVKNLSDLLMNPQFKLEKLHLYGCRNTEKQCLILTSALKSNPSHLRELNLSWNQIKNTGVNHLCDILNDSHCKLEILRLSDCSITEEGYKALASALRSNPSHLIELDLTGNDPGQSGVEELSDFLQDANCQLKTLRFLGPAADEACQYVTGIVGKNPLLLRELNLSEHELGDTRVNQIAALLQDKHCQLNTLNLWDCSITEEQCLILTSALKSNPSHLRELDLGGNKLGDSGVKNLSDLLMNPQFKLEKLDLWRCSITEEQCLILTSALKSNPSHLRELNLNRNKLGDSGVKNLSDLLMNLQFKLEKLDLWDCSITEEQCLILTSALKSNPSHLRELNLGGNKLGDSAVKNLSDLLMNPQFKLEKLHLWSCSITEEQCLILTSALKSNPSHLRELKLNRNKLGDSGVKNLSDLLMNPQFKLEKLNLWDCSITEEQCLILTSALKSNPSHLRELDLGGNKLGDSGVKNLSDLLMNPQFKLEKLDLWDCSITEEQCLILTLALKSNPSHLRELDLGGNKLGDSGVKNLSDLLMNPQFKLEKLHLWSCSITEEQCLILTSALKSNPSHLRELKLNRNKLGDSGVKNLSDLLMNPQFKLEKLHLWDCSITEEQCLILTSALKSNPSHLRELDLGGNKLGDSGVKNLSDLLMNPQFKLEKLDLWRCSITEEQCLILTSALKSNPSHLRDLKLNRNKLGDSGVKILSDLLMNLQFKLEKLHLYGCGITDVSSLTQSLTNTQALQFLKELDLRDNMIGDSKQQLIDVLRNSNCKLSVRSGSDVYSSVSVKSDRSKDGEEPNFSEETARQTKHSTLQNETLAPDLQTNKNHKDFQFFQDLESKIITFLKKELEKFKKILQKENLQNLVNDFNENKCIIKDAALDLTLYFLREIKQDEAANTLEDELVFIHQLKCNLKKKYQCVFEGIAKQGDSTLLKNIYTDLYITQGCSEQVSTEHEVRQIEVASRRHEPQEIQVECKDLFEAAEQDKQIRTILTKGVAGIGKSVSVQKFVLDWAEKKENQDISFIFPLPFREMNIKEREKLSLMDLITQFFPETKGLNLTRKNQFRVLFILDGLDECRLPLNFQDNEMLSDVSSPASLDVLLTNLIKGNLLPSALIWITTRPAAASKIPPDCIDRLTEIRGFNDAQKEEYFRKRISNENLAKEIIDHVKQSKSLFIMCHIPVFCWISATVLQNILEEKRNVVKNNDADDTSKTLQESNTEDTPETLTQMYTHFLRFQVQQSRRKYDGEYSPDVSWDIDAVFSLGKLAFDQLERNNVIFYESDLEACGIDVHKASVYSGMCTQIFKEETGIVLGTMYCFVHLSIQEFIAALYAHLFLDIKRRSIFVHKSTEQENKSETMIDLLKSAVDKALESNNGHLDLFLRFLLGLSLQSNRQLLRGLLTQQNGNDQIKHEMVQYIKQKFEANLSPERSINLFYCLNELNDQTLVKEIQTHLSKGSLSSADLSPAQWSALAFVLLTSEEELEEFELQKFKNSDECLIRLLAVIKTSKRALLNDCGLTDKSCSALATVLGSDTSLKDLNMSNNNLQDSGVKLLCTGLQNMKCCLEMLRLSNCSITEEGCKALFSALRSNPSHLIELDLTGNDPGQSGVKELSDLLQDPDCQLKILRLSDCSITEEGYKALASALRSNPSHLIELDLTGNDPGQSGVKELNDLLQDPNCQLKTLRFLGPAAVEACQYVTGIVGKNPLLLRELNLSGHELGDTRVNLIAALLQDKHCQLNTLIMSVCSITEEQCLILTSALKSNPSHLRELDLSENQIKNTGVNHLCDILKDSHCKLERLRLRFCDLTDKGCSAVTSALKSNPSHLRELNLSGNQLGDSVVKHLSDLLMNPQFKLEKLHLWDGSITKEQCLILTSALKSNPSHLRELDLSENKLGDSGLKNLSDLLMNPQFKLKKLHLWRCSITEKQCLILTTALKSNPSHLRELDLSENEIKNTGVNLLCDVLKDSNCKLERLRLSYCDLTDECCSAVTSALQSNPSHLRELNLSKNELGDSGVKNLSDLLMNQQLKLEKLHLYGCRNTEKQCLILTSALKSNPSHLRELNLSWNQIKNTGVNHLCDILKDSHCKLERLRLSKCSITEEGYKALASALRSNPSHLIELDLTGNDPGQSGVKELNDLLQDPNCQLKTLRFLGPAADEACQYVTGIVGKNPLLLRELNLSKHELGDTGVNQIAAVLQDKHCTLNTL
ncbi:hypothetical protein QQF64_019758, partial [Cirrhinus molitorella]